MLSVTTRNSYRTLLDAAVLREGDSDIPAIIYVSTEAEPIRVSRQLFRESALHYAAVLKGLGIGQDDLVIIAHTQNLESIYAFWGAMMVGAIPSMFPTLTEKLDPDIYMRDMSELVARSAAKVILTTDAFAPTLAERVECPVYGSQQLVAGAHAAGRDESGVSRDLNPYEIEPPSRQVRQDQGKELNHRDTETRRSEGGFSREGSNGIQGVVEYPAPDAIAFLQHSSGTTGIQKGVALSHESVLNQLASYGDALGLNEQDIIISWLPLYHDMGLIAGFIQPLVQGIPLVLMSPFDWVRHPAMLLKAIYDYKATLCWLPNFAYNHLARTVRQRDSDGLDLSSIRAFINCSEPVRYDSHTSFAERFAANGITMSQLSVSYAMAENTFAVTQTAVGQHPTIDQVKRLTLQHESKAVPSEDEAETEKIVSCGKPINRTAIKVVSESGQKLGERQVGEILVKSDCMLNAYYKRDDLQPFDAEGWYQTGDKGYIADGEIYIVGRSKDLIINAGKNVYPQDIEAIVNSVAGIHAGRTVVFGVADEREGTELIAVVAEVDVNDAATRKQITQAIRQQVVRQSDITLNFVTLVDKGWLIKTSSGKIARGKNREKWLAERQSQ